MVMTRTRPADYKMAVREAERIISEFGYDRPPVDPAVIAREMGVKVFFVEFDKEDSNISGYYDADDNSINVNQEEYPQRQTFTIAHELGHKVMHEDWAKSSDYRVLLRDQTPKEKSDPVEQEANCFAANLLVPRSMLLRYKDRDVETLARLFAVSRPMITFRKMNET